MPQVAGARRGQFNHRFAQPSDQSQPSFGHLMPFADDPQTDPLTGETAACWIGSARSAASRRCIAINTSAEYWRGDCLAAPHRHLADTRDVEPPAEVARYLFASTQHGPGALPLTTSRRRRGRDAAPTASTPSTTRR